MPITGTAIYKLNQILIQISVTIFKDLELTTLKEYGGTKTILRKKIVKDITTSQIHNIEIYNNNNNKTSCIQKEYGGLER